MKEKRKIEKIYYDFSKKKYLVDIEEEKYPVDSYLKIIRGRQKDGYEESWLVERKSQGNNVVNIVYPSNNLEIDQVKDIRNRVCQDGDCSLIRLTRLTITSHDFDELIKKYIDKKETTLSN